MAILEVLKEKNIEADVSAGLSLGEYSALIYSGALSFEEGIKLARGMEKQLNDIEGKIQILMNEPQPMSLDNPPQMDLFNDVQAGKVTLSLADYEKLKDEVQKEAVHASMMEVKATVIEEEWERLIRTLMILH